MKKTNWIILVLTLCFMGGILSGCNVKETVFTSKDGIHIQATTKWKEATEKQLLEEIYDGLTKEDLEYVDLALTTYDNLVFLIEKMDISEYRASIIEEVEFAQEMVKEITDMGLAKEDIKMVFAEIGIEYTEEDQAYFDEVTATDFDLEKYIGDTLATASELSLEEQYSKYSLLNTKEITLFNQLAYMREYTYQNGEDAHEMHVYEVDVIKGDMCYTLHAATPVEKFEKNKEQLETMILTAYEGEVIQK